MAFGRFNYLVDGKLMNQSNVRFWLIVKVVADLKLVAIFNGLQAEVDWSKIRNNVKGNWVLQINFFTVKAVKKLIF